MRSISPPQAPQSRRVIAVTAAIVTTFLVLLVLFPSRPLSSITASLSSTSPARPSNDTLSPVTLSSFEHLPSARFPKTSLEVRQCDSISPSIFHRLADGPASTFPDTPLAFHYHNGQAVSVDDHAFSVTSEFCSLLFVPQRPTTRPPDGFQNIPIDGWGPDALHLELASEDVRIMLEHPRYWGVISSNHRVFAVYTTAYTLNHPGNYQLSGEVEFTNYDWVMEDPVDTAAFNADFSFEVIPYIMLNYSLATVSPPISITGLPISRPTTICNSPGDSSSLRGRWYRAAAFNSTGTQTALNPSAHVLFADQPTTIDEWGWTFAPDACSLPFFSPEDHLSCLGDHTIQILGDSNSRRVLKSVMGGGQGWCQDPDQVSCNCEDGQEGNVTDVLGRAIDVVRFGSPAERADPVVFGNNTSVYFDFVGGLAFEAAFNPWHLLYTPFPSSVLAASSPSFFLPPDPASDPIMTVNDYRRLTHGAIDILHISLIGWDAAFMRSPASTLAVLPRLRDTLLAAHPSNTTRFVHRTANPSCCGNQHPGGQRQRYSGPRFAIWNFLWTEFWKEEGVMDMRLVDAAVLAGRRDAEVRNACSTTHFRASHVRIEQMMWMGAVCETGGDGVARLREVGAV